MEGPSLYLAQRQLRDFRKQKVLAVSGNTKEDKARLNGLVVRDIFSWGKHLVFQFDDFALRVHFMLFGTFTANVGGHSVTGDYKKHKLRDLRCSLRMATFLFIIARSNSSKARRQNRPTIFL